MAQNKDLDNAISNFLSIAAFSKTRLEEREDANTEGSPTYEYIGALDDAIEAVEAIPDDEPDEGGGGEEEEKEEEEDEEGSSD